MKKIFTTLLIVLGFYSLSFAQKDHNTEFGVNIGYSSAYIEESNSGFNADAISTFNAAVSVDTYFSYSWSLKIKAIYDQKGFGNGYLTGDDGSEIDNVDFKLNYITIPIMANWHFGRDRSWYLNFGPYIGFLTSAKAYGYDVKNSFNSTDGGLAFGIGYKFPITNRSKFFVEFEGQSGVTNVGNDNFDGSRFNNERGSVNVGINF